MFLFFEGDHSQLPAFLSATKNIGLGSEALLSWAFSLSLFGPQISPKRWNILVFDQVALMKFP